MHKDSVQRTLLVAFLLCVVCSIVVATAAVSLAPVQQENQLLDKRKNILVAAGLAKPADLTAEKLTSSSKTSNLKVLSLQQVSMLTLILTTQFKKLQKTQSLATN